MFKDQYIRLLKQAERIKAQRPKDYKSHKMVKLLAKITNLILAEIPLNPGHANYNLGNTLGSDYRHWRRDKFGRYRLFFRYRIKPKPDSTEDKIIVYVWINDDSTLRKEGDKKDPYTLFAKGLKRGEPPDTIDALLKESTEFEISDS